MSVTIVVRIRRRISLGKYLSEVWLPAAARTVRPSTLSGYRSHVRHYLVPHLGSIHLHRLTANQLNAFYSDVSQKNSVARHKPPSATTVRRIHATLHRALNDAVKWGYLDANPASKCDPPRAGDAKGPMRTWTATEVAEFLAVTADHPLHEVWVLLATTGMRRGEVLGLRWGDVDLDKGRVAVRQSVTVVDNEIRVSDPKSRRSRRVVALDTASIRTLLNLRANTPQARPDELVFSSDGRPLNPTKVSKVFRKLVDQTDLGRIRLHDLRHTHATLALQAGLRFKPASIPRSCPSDSGTRPFR